MATSQEIIEKQKDILIRLMEMYNELGLNTRELINEFKAMKILEEPLWKIPEANGKSNQRYISAGVKNIRQVLDDNNIKNRRNAKSIWTDTQLKKAFEQIPNLLPSLDLNHYKVQLEHVVERKVIIDLILENPGNILEIVNQNNVGCLVLESEHNQLPNELYDDNDIWVRYRGNIRVWDRCSKKWVF